MRNRQGAHLSLWMPIISYSPLGVTIDIFKYQEHFQWYMYIMEFIEYQVFQKTRFAKAGSDSVNPQKYLDRFCIYILNCQEKYIF